MAKDNNNEEGQSLEGSSILQPSNDTNTASEPTQDQTLDSSSAATDDQPPKKRSVLGKFSFFANLYFLIFLLLLLLAAGGIYLTIKTNNKSNNSVQGPKVQSLTDKQIADLKGNTTLVGTSQQTLDIQGNSIFEGPALMRSSLDVAGSIQVGGTLSLPSIIVGGASSFGQVQVNQTLSVGGNTTLQGQLTLQKGLTVAGGANFATLSTGVLSVSSLQLNGDLLVSHHINVSGGTPSRSDGTALGGGGTVSGNGTDTAGTITINTGSSPPAGCFVNINFTQHFNTTPHVVISPSNPSAGLLDFYTNRSNTNFSICDASAPAASTTYVFDYVVID